MYNDQDLDEAVASGAISADAAASLRNYLDGTRSSPSVDEEQFRLVTSFNDIFVSIASAILLFAVAWIGQSIGQATGLVIKENFHNGPSPLAPLAVAAVAWGLATFFTAKRRMALPSILLLLAFVGGVFATVAMAIVLVLGTPFFTANSSIPAIIAAVGALVAAIAAYLHWKRFHVPITVAAGAAAMVGLVLALIAAAIGSQQFEQMRNILLVAALLLGVGVFLFAMY